MPNQPVTGQIKPDRIVRTVCSPNCTGSCGINAFVKDGRLLKIEPAEMPDNRYNRICLKGISMAMQRVEHPDRIRHPMLRKGDRGSGDWQRIGWNDAFDYLAEKLTGIAERYGPEANSWISMTGNYGIMSMMLSARVANSLGGTAFTNLGIMGDLGANMGYLPTLGVHQEANEWPDIVGSKLIVLFGKNIADTAHSDIHFMFDAMEQGARVVSIDPRYSRTSAKADQWIPIRPGTDAAMILAMIKVIIDADLHDADYLRGHSNAPYLVREDTGKLLRYDAIDPAAPGNYVVVDAGTGLPADAALAADPVLDFRGEVRLAGGGALPCRTGFNALLEGCRSYTPEQAEAISEVPAAVIRELALDYAKTDPASLWIGQGTQRYYNGHQAFRALITLGAITGNIGKRHAGVSWGGGSLLRFIFATPDEWLAPNGHTGRVYPGTRIHDIIEAAEPYPVKSLWAHNYGFGTQTPRRNRFINEVLPHLELFTVSELVMTQAAKCADIVLPATSYYEEDADIVASWNNMYVQLRTRAIDNVGESRSDWEIFKGVCERMGRADDWSMTAMESCEYILRNSKDPIFSNIDWEELRREKIVRAEIASPHVPFADLKFPTPSGRIELYTESLVEHGQGVPNFEEPIEGNRRPRARDYPLTFMSNHSMYSVNAQHTILPWIREVQPDPRVEMSPVDAGARGVSDGDAIRVFNDRGTFTAHVNVTEGIKPGALNLTAGWWPEHFIDGHYSDLTHMPLNAAQETILESNYPIFDVSVEVEKAGEPEAS
ncbi:MAG: molybdopterin-dependent oxidoreductase [Gammaproteobacteria bacterium]|nr:molybdopterin-dependent oxidoreductase [Gammaproteobacteria bacterium]NNL99208.1 molybdopterin-dependent oxidoreductase [Gammaproteobacteria bacterium]